MPSRFVIRPVSSALPSDTPPASVSSSLPSDTPPVSPPRSLPVESYSLEVRHAEGSEPVTSQAETTNTRWSVVRPLWNAVYNVTLRVKIAGVALDWALYTVRAKLDCPGGQRRCQLNGAGQLFGRRMYFADRLR